MTKAKSVRKKVLKRNKNIRKNQQGKPKNKTKGRQMMMMMKDFNNFVKRKFEEGKLVDHKDVGLPNEVSGEDVIISTPYVYSPSDYTENIENDSEAI